MLTGPDRSLAEQILADNPDYDYLDFRSGPLYTAIGPLPDGTSIKYYIYGRRSGLSSAAQAFEYTARSEHPKYGEILGHDFSIDQMQDHLTLNYLTLIAELQSGRKHIRGTCRRCWRRSLPKTGYCKAPSCGYNGKRCPSNLTTRR